MGEQDSSDNQDAFEHVLERFHAEKLERPELKEAIERYEKVVRHLRDMYYDAALHKIQEDLEQYPGEERLKKYDTLINNAKQIYLEVMGEKKEVIAEKEQKTKIIGIRDKNQRNLEEKVRALSEQVGDLKNRNDKLHEKILMHAGQKSEIEEKYNQLKKDIAVYETLKEIETIKNHFLKIYQLNPGFQQKILQTQGIEPFMIDPAKTRAFSEGENLWWGFVKNTLENAENFLGKEVKFTGDAQVAEYQVTLLKKVIRYILPETFFDKLKGAQSDAELENLILDEIGKKYVLLEDFQAEQEKKRVAEKIIEKKTKETPSNIVQNQLLYDAVAALLSPADRKELDETIAHAKSIESKDPFVTSLVAEFISGKLSKQEPLLLNQLKNTFYSIVGKDIYDAAQSEPTKQAQIEKMKNLYLDKIKGFKEEVFGSAKQAFANKTRVLAKNIKTTSEEAAQLKSKVADLEAELQSSNEKRATLAKNYREQLMQLYSLIPQEGFLAASLKEDTQDLSADSLVIAIQAGLEQIGDYKKKAEGAAKELEEATKRFNKQLNDFTEGSAKQTKELEELRKNQYDPEKHITRENHDTILEVLRKNQYDPEKHVAKEDYERLVEELAEKAKVSAAGSEIEGLVLELFALIPRDVDVVAVEGMLAKQLVDIKGPKEGTNDVSVENLKTAIENAVKQRNKYKEDAEDKAKALEELQRKYDSETKAKNQELEDLRAKLKAAEENAVDPEKYIAIEEHKDKLKQQEEKITQDYSPIAAELAEIKGAKAELENELQKANAGLTEKITEAEGLRKELVAAKAYVFDPEIHVTKEEYDAEIEERQNLLNVREERITALRTEKTELEKRVTEINNEKARLNADLHKAREEAFNPEKHVTKEVHQQQIDKLDDQITRLTLEFEKLEKGESTEYVSQAFHEQEVSQLKEKIEALKDEKSMLMKTAETYANADKIIKGQETKIAELNQIMKNLETQLAEKDAEIAEVKAQAAAIDPEKYVSIEEFKGAIAEKDSLLKSKQERIETLAANAEGLQGTVETLRKELDAAHEAPLDPEDYVSLEEHNNKLKEKEEVVTKKYEPLLTEKSNQIAALQKAKEGLEQTLKQKESELEALNSEAAKKPEIDVAKYLLISEHERLLAEERTSYNTELEKLRSQLAGIIIYNPEKHIKIEDHTKAVEEAKTTLESEIERLNKEIEAAAKITGFDSNLHMTKADHESDVSSLRTELAKAQENAYDESKHMTKKDHDTLVAKKEEEHAPVVAELAAVKGEKSELQQKYEALEASKKEEIEKLTKEKESIESIVKTKSEEIENVKAQLAGQTVYDKDKHMKIEDHIAKLKEEKTAYDSQIVTLKSQLASITPYDPTKHMTKEDHEKLLKEETLNTKYGAQGRNLLHNAARLMAAILGSEEKFKTYCSIEDPSERELWAKMAIQERFDISREDYDKALKQLDWASEQVASILKENRMLQARLTED